MAWRVVVWRAWRASPGDARPDDANPGDEKKNVSPSTVGTPPHAPSLLGAGDSSDGGLLGQRCAFGIDGPVDRADQLNWFHIITS